MIDEKLILNIPQTIKHRINQGAILSTLKQLKNWHD